MIPVIDIETEHLNLKPFGAEDVPYIMTVHQQSARTVFDDVDSFKTDADFEDHVGHILKSAMTGWTIVHKESDIRLGVVYFVDLLAHVTANFHPVSDVPALKDLVPLDSSGQRLRSMDEASRAVITYMADRFKLQRVGAAFGAHNVPAIKLCERIGMRHEGRIQNGLRVKDRPIDLIILGITAQEIEQWPSGQPQLS